VLAAIASPEDHVNKAEYARSHVNDTLATCDNPAPGYRGKVRDVYARRDELLLVASDRVSAFDVVLGTIPLKGALLTEQATFWLKKAAGVVKTHFIDRPDAQAMVCRRAQPLPIEVVVRGYLAGSLAREPNATRGQAYGVSINPTLKTYEQFPKPIVTPTTKAKIGDHDKPISPAQIVATGLVNKNHMEEALRIGVALFEMGAAFAKERGLILVDTKYEFGLIDGEITLIDEIHTADSSRFWVLDGYADALANHQAPTMLDKERLRQWLLHQGYSGAGTPPVLTEEVRVDLAVHYWDLTERLLGQPFVPPTSPPTERIPRLIQNWLSNREA
jgi:phosphoribosylaminoimidazole-succinocarboxamide synthase